MTVEWQPWFRRIAAEHLFGGAALAVLIFLALQLGFGLAATAVIGLAALALVALVMRDLRKRSATLEQSERHWREVFEQHPTMYFLVDVRRTIVSANAVAIAQLGHAADEFAGRSFLDVSAEEDRPLVESHLALCAEKPGQSHAWEARKVRKDGAVIWARENARFVQWDASEPVFLVSCEDITERRKARQQAEEAMNRSQAYLHEAQRLGRMGSWSLDVSSRTFSASPEWFRIFRVDPARDELTEDLVPRLVHPEDRAFFESVQQTRGMIGDREYGYRIVLPNGEVRHIHSISHAVTGKDGVVVDVVGTSMDVTERRLAEEAVRRSEASLHEAQRMGHMGSWSLNVVSGTFSASPEWFRIFAIDPRKDTLTVDLFRGRVHPDDRAFVEGLRETHNGSIADYHYDYRIVLPDGDVRHVHSISHAVHGENAAVVEVVGTTLDVTELKRAEEALRQAYADLARVSRINIMGELTASLAHEINQPITAAVANANACLRWLADEKPDLDEARAAVEAILGNGRRAAEIIGRTRRLFEKGAAQRELVEIDDVVRETVLLLSGEASRHSVSIRSALAGGATMADRVQLQQVLMNLILNGIDATREIDGPREIAIRSRIADNGEITVSVADTGVGLPGGKADRLFETFFTTKPHGTGMGLSISRSIITAHGGRLWAEPNPPRGAAFRFTLPHGPPPPDRQ